MGSSRPGGSKCLLLVPNRVGQMLAAYRANMGRGSESVREMILSDIRRFSDLGASSYVDDLAETLFMFDEEAIARVDPLDVRRFDRTLKDAFIGSSVVATEN
jgi:hypothetical protein